ncbi:hypothetical protein bcgnr5383_48540 [Bacillus cereus]
MLTILILAKYSGNVYLFFFLLKIIRIFIIHSMSDNSHDLSSKLVRRRVQ